MCDAFFHLNFLNARGILAQKIYDARTTFRRSQRPSVLGQLVCGGPQYTGISRPKEI